MVSKIKYGNTNTFFIRGTGGNLLIDTDYAGTLSAFYRAIKQHEIKISDQMLINKIGIRCYNRWERKLKFVEVKTMNEECLICKAPLEYLDTDILMECEICHKKQNSKTRCVKGHFVCDECHTSGLDEIFSICLNDKSVNPVEILEKMMSMPTCHMHGPEHHVMVGAALLTAYKNAGGEIDLKSALSEMQKRGKQVPGGVCGFWGACGAGISTGIFFSIALKATPLAKEAWGLSNQMTAKALESIGKNGGPRCCKRDSYLAIVEAVKFTSEQLGIKMELTPIICTRSRMNNQCIQNACPFHRNNE